MRVALLIVLAYTTAYAAPIPPEPKPDPNGKAVLGIHSSTSGRVDSFYPVSPFKKSGGKTGDIVTKIGTEPVKDIRTLVRATKMYRPGATVQVEVMRGTKKITLIVVLGEETK